MYNGKETHIQSCLYSPNINGIKELQANYNFLNKPGLDIKEFVSTTSDYYNEKPKFCFGFGVNKPVEYLSRKYRQTGYQVSKIRASQAVKMIGNASTGYAERMQTNTINQTDKGKEIFIDRKPTDLPGGNIPDYLERFSEDTARIMAENSEIIETTADIAEKITNSGIF